MVKRDETEGAGRMGKLACALFLVLSLSAACGDRGADGAAGGGPPDGTPLADAGGQAAGGGDGAARVPFVVPDPATMPDGPLGISIRRGRALIEHTRDSLPGFVGNDLRCTSCHLDGGLRANVMPFVGVYARFPQYRGRSARVIDLEERIGDCFVRSMNGTSPAYDSPEMRDMIAYLAWLSRGVPVGREMHGQGMVAVAPLTPDTAAGRVAFNAECARCHGEDGQGLIPPAPPLWGPRSFNIGAGMTRLRTAAAFIRAAMPYDRPGSIAPQMAYDIAAYMNSHSRPDLPGKENDWPLGGAPVDAAYETHGRQ